MKLPIVGKSVAAGLACMFWASASWGTEFLWSYESEDMTIIASGTLDATLDSGTSYIVTSIAGQRNGVALNGLANYSSPSQHVYFPAGSPSDPSAQLDFNGLAFFVGLSGNAFNVFFDPSDSDVFNCGRVGYCELGPGVDNTLGDQDSRRPIGFTLASVPEPASQLLLGVALLALAAVLRRKRSH